MKMKQTNFLRHFSRMLFVAMLLLHGLPMWAKDNVGDENKKDRTLVAPWKFEKVKWEQNSTETRTYKWTNFEDRDADIWEYEYSCVSGHKGYGYKLDRYDGSGKVAQAMVRYQLTDQIPPYARLEADWHFYFSTQGDFGYKQAALYYFTGDPSNQDMYMLPDVDVTDNSIPNHEFVFASSSNRCGLKSCGGDCMLVDGVKHIVMDNSGSSTAQTMTHYMVHTMDFRGDGNSGHIQSTIETVSYTANYVYPEFNGTGTASSPLQISTATQLKKLGDIVKCGLSCTRDLHVVLMNDIDYSNYTDASAMIGTKDYPFSGVFDGQGHTITLALECTDRAALFGYVKDATIQNLELNGSLQTSTHMSAALIADCRGTTTISNVIVRSKIITTKSGALGNAGLVAVGNDSKLTITNCGFTGSLICSNSAQGRECASFVGSLGSGGSANLTNCYFAPDTIQNISSEGSYTFVRLCGGTSTITNCYYTKDFGKAQGTKVSNKQMESGEVCWKLNEEKEGGDWLQTIGLDTRPTLWDALHVYKANDKYYNFKPSFRGAGTAADPFQIENYEQLARFRDIVNAGYTTICAKLVTDIDLAQYNWEPIGRKFSNDSMVIYNGVFDGNGYVIHNLNINTGVDYFNGLFGYVDGATIKNVLVHNATIHNSLSNHVGVIAGRAENTTFQNCASYGTLHLTGDGANFSGIARAAENVTMTSCYTTYSVLSTSSPTIQYSYCGQNVAKWHASGELTYKLNNSAPTPWLQTLGRDDYPVLRGAQNVNWNDSKYINYITEEAALEAFANTTSGNDFRIIHHGGHLYEFVITMGTQDGNGVHVTPDVTISYVANNTSNTIMELSKVNSDSASFGKDWWGKIEMKSGTYYDVRSYHKQVPTFWIRQGNHSTKKQTSILWLAPSSIERDIVSFQLKGKTSSLNITSNVESTTAPSDDVGLLLVDPVVNIDNKEAGSGKVIFTASNNAYSAAIWDATDDKFVLMQETASGVQSLELSIPQQDRVHNLVLLTFARVIEYGNSSNDTTYCNYGIPFVQQPCHSIVRTNIRTDHNATNTLDWAIAFPNDSDILDTDQFILQRATQSDFSDAKKISLLNVRDFTTTTTENDTLLGWLSFEDEDAYRISSDATQDTVTAFDQWNISASAKAVLGAYKYPAHYLYYKVYRMMVASLWNQYDKYIGQWKMLQTNVLPTVDSVRVIKTDNWEQTHKVKVRVVLRNPYPWDIVPAADRNAVYEEAQKQLFARRMFTWDPSASITLKRFSMPDEYDHGIDAVSKDLEISGDQVMVDTITGDYYIEYEDIQSLPFTHYYYKARVKNAKSNYPICESRNEYVLSSEEDANACYSETYTSILNFQATRGDYNNAVSLTWESDEVAGSTLEMRARVWQYGYDTQVSQPGSEWRNIAITSHSATDDQASAAVVNQYILTITTTYRDMVFIQSDTTYGYAGYYGTLDGRVKMSNGVNMPGNVHVVVNCNTPFILHEVTHPKTGETILPACRYDVLKYDVKTDANGAYKLDFVPFYGSGYTYTVYATCEGATFVSPTGSSSTIDLTYEDANNTYSDIDFTCNDTKQFSGRILYTNSTVPVRDVMFKVNGTILRDAKGEAVVTDAMGNFSFNVPRMEVTVQAYRPGHKMSNGGFILGGEDGQQKTFTPTHDYDGLIIDDDTKVRLVGRVAGGVIQGIKPMGFGLSHNNLGDSITLVLKLEGDNTSYLYFDKQNPDELSYSTTFTQRVTDDMSIDQRIPTNAIFEAKRIVVKADNKTGEFCLDLFPTKYVVAQMYANGYGTLYSEGEGLTVLDLTDSVGLHVHYADRSFTEYDASFRRVYHAPVQIDLKQMTNNKYQDLYGETNSTVEMLSGKQTMQLAWRDSDNVAQYAFGYPVYKGNKQYFYQVQAYEPYYYNNIPTGRYERVPMAGYEVSISNGLSRIVDSEEEDDEDDEDGIVLNAAGMATFSIVPNNTTFSITEEDALRYLSASVDINGYHYESEPIAGFVTGEKDFGKDIITDIAEGDIQILDYIRDPYGADSYAYRMEGTTYNWSRHYSKEYSENCYFYFRFGVALLLSYSIFNVATETEYDISGDINVDATTKHDIVYKDGEFTLELSEQLSTSDDPLDQGAIADIYLGTVSTVDLVRYQGFNVIDSASYAAILPFMDNGDARLVREGRNADGTPYYLVICGGVTWQPGTERIFAYSQRYILNTLIPNLEARRAEAFRVAANSQEAHAMADASGHMFYYSSGDGYVMVPPASAEAVADTVALIDKRIQEWKDIIATNERIKIEAMNGKPNKQYSFAGVSFEHSEEASTYYRECKVDAPTPVDISGGLTSGHNSSSNDQKDSDSPAAGEQDKGEQGKDGGQSGKDDNENKDNKKSDDSKKGPDFAGLGIIVDLDLGGGHYYDISDEWEDYYAVTGGSGYYISAHDNSYFDMDVYYQNDTSVVYVNQDFMDVINAYEGGDGVDEYKVKSGDELSMTEDNAYVHSYIFVMRGGATREPWVDADSTVCYLAEDGSRMPLGSRTLKIDNPKIYVENPVIYNLPQDEKAVFTVHISNETELTGNVKDIISSIYLHVADDSNPYGAKISVDGVPLHNYMEFFVNPGESITKTLEVERGGKPYDYEDILLEVSDEEYRQWDDAYISVHYLPTSTPVTLTQPAQNFLINTLSQQDEDGKYYIPVQIEGFSTTKYDNFDHIELQYKRQTDGEDQWVNLCSYYTNELLYKVATGNKAMIETEGKISDIRFYGEKDPVEQKYDLRAVSFCRLGNGYTTRISSVISGTKDTRCPEVFGMPKPEDGILDFSDVISLPFTEPIAYNYLDETANFSVQGFTNNSDVDNSVALYFDGSDNQQAVSEVDRVLNAMDFSVEMNVKVESDGPDSVVFMAINDDFSENADNTFIFGYNTKTDVLVSWMNGQVVKSKPLKTSGLTLTSAMTHVGMTYTIADSTVRFFVGEQQVDVAEKFKDVKPVCHANGIVNIGTQLQGKMNNVRLWSKALNLYEMTSKYKKQLSSNEANLLGYWPANEASGSKVADLANGATLTLTDVSWSLPDGYSVNLDHETMDILSNQALKYTRNKKEDYTISFYFKVDELDDDANLFAAGGDNLEETGMDKVRIRFMDGVLYFVSEGQQTAFGDGNTYAEDGNWHYLAVSVNHAQNKASLFIDGALVNQMDANNVGGVTGSQIVYGDANMAAHIDQVQMWSMSLPASYIKTYYNAGLTGKEKELQIYLPFEQEAMNDQGTMYTTFSPLNHVIVESTGKIAGDTVIDKTLVTEDDKVIAPVRSSTGIENLPFTWKSTDNELQITINKSNAEINNQHLSLVVRRVEDLNGNPMKNAQMWTTYVNRNVLTWLVPERTVVLPYGQDTTIVSVFTNASGRELGYTIDCSSPALTLSATMGTIQPLGEKAITATISDGLAPGVYQIIINLTDEDGLSSTQTINLRVVAQSPDWQATIDPSYNQSMNVIAQVKKQEKGIWTLDMCPKDKVAAFIGKECVGVANLKVDAEANTSYLYITVRGKAEVTGQKVEFRLWSALTGDTYILEAAPEVTFAALNIVGVDKPVELRAYEMRVQTLSLNPGWNWVSLYVDPFADKGLNNLFSNQKQLTQNDVFRTPFGSTFATFQSNGLWDASLDDMSILKNNVYQIYAQYSANVEVSGALYEDRTITLDFTQSEWAQMAYLADKSMPVRQALSDFVAGSEKAPAGTIIKGYEDFAIATADGKWVGSLEYMRPGEGYFVRRNGLRESLTITFTNTSAASPTRRQSPTIANNRPSSPTMMPLVAAFADGDMQEGDMLLAMVGKEVVAVSEAMGELFFVSLHAAQGEAVQFAKVRNGEVVAVTSKGLKYDAQGQAGTVEKPYLIDFSGVEENAPIYDILGMKMSNLQLNTPRVLIQDGKKVIKR